MTSNSKNSDKLIAQFANTFKAHLAYHKLLKLVTSVEVELVENLDLITQPALRETLNEDNNRSKVYLGITATKAALVYASSNSQDYRSHGFLFEGHDLEYIQDNYDTDGQPQSDSKLHLAGFAAIALDRAARNELIWLSSELKDKLPELWNGDNLGLMHD